MTIETALIVFALLILFQIKHFCADYLQQNAYMLGKFKEKGWVRPLLAHVAVHMAWTCFIVFFLTANWWLAVSLALFDLVIHFSMDRIKASPTLLGRYNPQQKQFWWALGLDQMVHHVTHYAIIICILLQIL